MDQDKKNMSQLKDEKLELAAIVSSFHDQYVEWLSGKQIDFTNNAADSSASSKEGNCEETTSELPSHNIHGFVNEILYLKNLLLKQKDSDKFNALAIVGKYGVGKTTLCQVVFNDVQVKQAYLPRIWVSLCNKGTKIDVVKRILISLGVEDEMLKHIETEAKEEKSAKDEAGVKDKETVEEKQLSRLLYALNLNLIGKKYLIVLDHVWEDNKWNDKKKLHLSCGFPKGFGGRVIVTSRDKGVAKKIVGEEEENLLHLFPRTDAESVWEIYSDAVGTQVNPRYPGRFKQELMDKCCGVPLAARMLAKIEPVKMDETSGGQMERKKSF